MDEKLISVGRWGVVLLDDIVDVLKDVQIGSKWERERKRVAQSLRS